MLENTLLAEECFKYANEIGTFPRGFEKKLHKHGYSLSTIRYNIFASCAIQMFAERLMAEPYGDPKEILDDIRLKFIRHVNEQGTKRSMDYFMAEVELNRLGFIYGIECEDNLSQLYSRNKERRMNGKKLI